jgi:methylenetetrahydrofolate dehydrogenase (NADP+)/methenyltetrahydrofolate cyclohydrolase
MKSYEEMKSSNVIIPCTPHAIIELLLETGINPRGLEALVVGRSNIVGKPVAHLLSCLDATVTLCHSKTRDLKAHVERADIVVAAAGVPGLIRGEWLKPKAIVMDAGISSRDGKLLGDVDFESAVKTAGMLTPVPGGIGPLTVICLVCNTVISAERRTQQRLGS